MVRLKVSLIARFTTSRFIAVWRFTEVLTDTVEYDYGIVHRETDNGKQGRDKVLVNFQGERYNIPEEGEYRQGNRNVMYDRHDRTH